MANDLIYNPLLKKGFQEVSDTGSIEAEIDDLRQHKVTKCLIPADLLSVEEGEIIQWQGLTQTIDNVQFVKGYFYICNGETVTVQPPVNYLNFTNDFPLNHEYNLNDYNFTFGKYYKVKSLNINVSNIQTHSYVDTNNQYRFLALNQIGIDTKVFDRQLNIFEIVTSIDIVNQKAITNNNQIINIGGGSIGTMQTFWETGDANGSNTFYILEPSGYMYYLLVDWDFENNILKAWFPFQCLRQTQNTSYNYNTEAFAQKNTQPPTPGITEDNGTLKVSLPVQFENDVTVKGTQTVVHTEEIESEADYIELRNGNPLGLANGERSGLEVNNYDGNGTDCILAVDNAGFARVGDSSGTLQKLATIEDNPTDGSFVQYDATAKELKTAAIPEATTTAAGLMSASDKSKIDNLTINTINIGATLFCGRITGSGNYLEIFIPCALPANASNLNLQIDQIELYFNGSLSSITYDTIIINSIIPLIGFSIDLKYTTTQTAHKTYFVLITGNLTFNT